jgi:hypothetical protein
MNLNVISWELQRLTPCREIAWADLRSPVDGIPQNEFFDGLMISAEQDDTDVIRMLLRSASKVGLPFGAQCRVAHRPEVPSKVRLHKGLFGERGRRTGAKTIELAVSASQVTLIGAWLLDDLSVKVAPEGCLDHSTCCFVVSRQPLDASQLVQFLARSVVSDGTCSINYPDFAIAICLEDHFILKAHPKYRERAILIGKRGSIELLRDWAHRVTMG